MAREISAQRLVGRRPELDRLRAVCRGVAGAAVALVGGDAGVGKTRLLATLVRELRDDDVVVLAGGCLDLGESAPAFSPLPVAFGSLASAISPVPPAPPELAMLVPSLPADDRPLLEGTRLRIFQAVASYLTELARGRRVTLVLEDLHWADSSTRELLAFLARTLAPGPISVVGSYRSDDLHRRHPLRATLAELARAGTVEQVGLEPLDATEVAELLHVLTRGAVAAHVAEEVHRRTDGNPFFIEELVACDALTGRLPDTLTDLVLVRVDRLSREQRAVLEAASVVGRRVDHEVLAETVTVPDLDVHLRALVDAGLLVVTSEDAASVSFRHALLHEAVHQRLLPWERAALHERVAAVLTSQPDLALVGGRMAELAVHHEGAGDVEAALRARVGAAEEAAAARTFDEAARHAEAAMRLWTRVERPEHHAGMTEVELLRRAAEWHHVAGRPRDAERLGERVLALLPGDAAAVDRALALERLGRYRWVQLDEQRGYDTYREAASVLPADAPSEARARVLAGVAQGLSLQDRPAEARAAAEEALVHARAAGDRALEGHVLNSLGMATIQLGDSARGMAILDDSLAIALERADAAEILRSRLNRSALRSVLGEHDAAVATAEAGARTAERYGARSFQRLFLGNALLAHLHGGDVDAAVAVAGRIGEVHLAAPTVRAGAGAVALAVGDLDAARRRLADVDPATSSLASAKDGDTAMLVLLETMWWRGALREAREAVATVVSRLEPDAHGTWQVALAGTGLRIEADLAARDRHDGGAGTDARGRADELLRLARDGAVGGATVIGGLWLAGWSALAEAEHARATGTADVARWNDAASALDEASQFPHLPAYARWRAAEQAVTDGDRDLATSLARTAFAAADRSRAAHVRRRVERLAEAARLDLGGSAGPSDETPDEPLSVLTPREREVLALVAAGRSNGQIGDELFISRKTASVHVSNILRKLGVANRIEAAMTAVSAGLVVDDG